jgi:mannitol-specific phosphotransferase system IIBC component
MLTKRRWHSLKKLLAVLLSLLFSFSVVAFAQDAPATDAGVTKTETKSAPVKKAKSVKKKKAKKSKKTKKTKEPDQQVQ